MSRRTSLGATRTSSVWPTLCPSRFDCRPDGVVDHNRALLDYAGPGDPAWQPAERWLHLLYPDDREHTLAVWDQSVRSGEPYRVEFRLRCVDGTHHWFLTRATAERDAAGKIVKWYGSSADIDEQKQLEAEARALATRLTKTLDSITDGFITFDTEWRITFVNRQAEGLLGRSAGALIGQNVWEAFPQAVGTRFEAEYRAALASGRTTRFEARFAPLDLYADISVYPSPEGLAVYFRDISAERAAHARLQLLQNAVARLSDIVVIAAVDNPDQVPRIVFINDAFARITGYPREEVIGQPYGFMLDEAADPAARARLTAALRAWQPVRAELPCRTHGGREIWLEIDLVPLAADGDRYTHWVGVERDISERLQLEGNLRQSQRLEALGQLTGGIAHDFNNLLTVILGNAEILSDGLKPGSEYHQLAEMILGAALRGSELTARLLAFARRQALDPQAVDINRLIVNLEPLLRRTLGEHVEIELVRGAGLWPALIDAGQLEDAVLNLCLNARDAMPGGGRLTIETANTRLDRDYAARHPSVEAGQYVLVAVSDTGTGIAPEDLERVFEPFFSTKEKGKGTGLGLSMVYGFIKQSGGHVNIYSEPGQGTTLRMYLPRAYGAAAAQEAETEERRSVGGREKVLLVEDDELVRRYAVRELAALGYVVLEAANGPRALEVFAAHPDIDLLFTDVVMPGGLSGRELADRVRVSRPDLRVLFTSGYTENAIVHHGRLDPGVHLLAKPYRRAELARAVRRALNGDGSEA